MTPYVHFDRDVALKIHIEVTSQSGSVTISGVTEPILSQRVVDQVIRLREGEASILGGIQDKQDEVSWTGIPGLSTIPILKYLFGSKDHTITDDELVFLVVPHVVRSQTLDQVNLRTVDTGTSQAIELRHVGAQTTPGAPAGAPVPAVVPAGTGPAIRPNVGVVPGQSAMAAAPAALAQMSASAEANGQTAASAVAAPSSAVPPATGANLMFSPPSQPIAVGATFQVPVVLTGGADVSSVPMQVQYDPEKLSLVNVTAGDLLGRDGQSAALIHRDDGPGSITINAARPPGTPGINGAGVVCVLSFQAKAAGQSALTMTRAAAVNSSQHPIQVKGSALDIVVR
jgi:general secretion pathway protein D